MSMILGLSALCDEDVGKVLAHPPLIWKVLDPEDPEAGEPAKKGGLLARWFGPPAPAAPELSGEGTDQTDLDKAWHGIHFLLTGTAWEGDWPLSFLLRGGAQVGDIDVGYGPARAFTSAEVREIAAALAPIDEGTMRSRFDPDKMTELDIYPTIWDRDPAEDDTLGYCVEYFGILKEFVTRAAARGDGIVIHLG